MQQSTLEKEPYALSKVRTGPAASCFVSQQPTGVHDAGWQLGNSGLLELMFQMVADGDATSVYELTCRDLNGFLERRRTCAQTLAEKEAWKLAKTLDLDLVRILPTYIVGPLNSRRTSTSVKFFVVRVMAAHLDSSSLRQTASRLKLAHHRIVSGHAQEITDVVMYCFHLFFRA